MKGVARWKDTLLVLELRWPFVSGAVARTPAEPLQELGLLKRKSHPSHLMGAPLQDLFEFFHLTPIDLFYPRCMSLENSGHVDL